MNPMTFGNMIHPNESYHNILLSFFNLIKIICGFMFPGPQKTPGLGDFSKARGLQSLMIDTAFERSQYV